MSTKNNHVTPEEHELIKGSIQRPVIGTVDTVEFGSTIAPGDVLVTFMANGIEYASRTVRQNTSIGALDMPSDPSKLYWTFEGWSTNPTATTPNFDSNSIVSTNIIIYAVFKRIPVIVVFNSELGVFGNFHAVRWVYAGTTINDPINQEANLLMEPPQGFGMPPDPTREGWVFVRWESNGITFDPTTIILPGTGAVVVQAIFRVITKIVTIGNQNGELKAGYSGTTTFPITSEGLSNGTYPINVIGLPSGVTAPPSVTITNNTGVLTLTGNTSTVYGTHLLNLEIDNAQSNAFQLVISRMYYTLTIIGGTGATDSGSFYEGLVINIFSGEPAEGDRFKDWTSDAGGVFEYPDQASTTFTMPANNVTITANFEPNEHTLTLNANGGTGSIPDVIVEHGTNVTIPINTFTRGGYSFASWNTAANGSGTTYPPTLNPWAGSIIYNVTEDITLYAQWTEVHSIMFDANGGTGTMNNGTVNHGADYTVPSSTTFTNEGYKLKNWNTAANGSGTTYALGSKILNVTNNITLYAQWEQAYSVTIAINISGVGDLGSFAYGTYTPGTVVNLGSSVYQIAAALNASGYNPTEKVFDYWQVTSGGVTLSDVNSASATFTMGTSNVKITSHLSTATGGSGNIGGGSGGLTCSVCGLSGIPNELVMGQHMTYVHGTGG